MRDIRCSARKKTTWPPSKASAEVKTTPMDELSTPETVELYIYDLSRGLASSLSNMILGKHIEGIWHTSIVIFGKEYYFGQTGISVCEPGSTNVGKPNKILKLGETHVGEGLFNEYLNGLKQSRFANGTYDLFKHNCNTFTNEVSQFLTSKGIPEDILALPDEILRGASSWLGHVHSFRESSPDFETLNNDIDAIRHTSAVLEQKRNKIKEKVERLERKRKKKKKHDKNKTESDNFNELDSFGPEYSRSTVNTSISFRQRYSMAENGQAEVLPNGNSKNPSDIAAELDEQEKKEREEKRRHREPPIVFPNSINVQEEFDKVIGLVDGNVPPAEMQFFEELHQYMLENEGSWAIGDGFLCFIGKLLSDQKFPEELRVRLLKVMAVAALKEDIILVLHQDRREHVFMNYANNFDRLPVEEQKSLALFVCNLFENPSSSEWLLYISEWESSNGNISNIRVTTKIAANSLLSENADLQNYGSAIIHNLACKEVFDDVAVELTMAVLQFFNSKPSEEHVFRCMKALAKFIEVSQQDVSQLVQMIGPQPDKFKGLSERVDPFITAIMAKLR